MGSTASTPTTIDEEKKSEIGSPRYLSSPVPIRIEIESEQRPLKNGYLLKRGFKNFASWKRRYCVLLSDGYFNYFNSKQKIKGSVNFSNAHQCISCSKDNKKFYVLTSKRTWEFKAESKNEANQWIKLIQKLMKNKPSINSNNNNNDNNNNNNNNESFIKHYRYNNHQQHDEFDSDDDTSTINTDDMKSQKQSSSSYLSKHKKRRSTINSNHNYYNINNKTTNNENITFNSWKISIVNALRDVIIKVEHRQKMNNYNPSNYNDEYHTISMILKDDKKLYKIFNRITNNKQFMTMKQYIASMSLIQKSKNEIGSIATKLLDNKDIDNNNNNDNVEMSPPSPNFVDLSSNHSYNNYYFNKKKQSNKRLPDFDTQSMISTLSTLSYFDDTQSIISDLSATSRRRRSRMRYSRTSRASILSEEYNNYNNNNNNNINNININNNNNNNSFKLSFTTNNSILSNIDGAFSILENVENDYNQIGAHYGQDLSDEELQFSELQLNEYDEDDDDEEEEEDDDQDDDQDNDDDILIVENEANIRVEIPVNPASEILGNFLGASCGLCVPGLDVITSIDSAETYKLLSEYTSNIDDSGNPPTLLVYEELDGVSLSDLKKQLEVVQISLHYNDNITSNKETTTQERIQKYFVSVVRKTFGKQLPYHFSHDGRSMIRDAGFIFSIDMLIINRQRFPVSLPFDGSANGNHLFISTDEDGDSALYGLQNRFMGGYDIIDMPYYLLNGGILTDDKSIKLLLNKQSEYTQNYIVKLQKFLSVLSDYYQTKISPNIDNSNNNNNNNNINHNPHKLLHGLPRTSKQNGSNNNRFAKINHEQIIDKCLRPIANFIYIHCGFELIIIDEYNNNPTLMSPKVSIEDDDDNDNNNNDNNNNNDKQDDDIKDKQALKVLEIYRNKLIDNMITLLCEGILIGISEISDQLETKDIDTIIQDIKTLDENMFGIELISASFLKICLRLFHSTATTFKLNIEDSSSDEDEDNDDNNTENQYD